MMLIMMTLYIAAINIKWLVVCCASWHYLGDDDDIDTRYLGDDDDGVMEEDNDDDDVMMMVVMVIIALLRHQVDVDALVAFTNSWWSMWEHFLISWGSLSFVVSTGNLFFSWS